MTKKNSGKKGSLIIVALLLVCFAISSCATFAIIQPSSFYSDSVTVGAKRGEDTSKVWIGFFGTESFPPADRVAQDAGIKKIATIEHFITPGILNLWMDYKTVVTGE